MGRCGPDVYINVHRYVDWITIGAYNSAPFWTISTIVVNVLKIVSVLIIILGVIGCGVFYFFLNNDDGFESD